MAHRKLLVADLFAGAGGTTTGAMQAIEEIGREVEFVAVNHWPIAIATHERNHPSVRHYCADLDSAKPNELVPDGELDLLLASPECRFHSPAQGGRPLDEQNRATAWHVLRWAERLYVRRIIVENVPRFLKWGPLDRKQRPIKSREGELFQAWVKALESLGYRVEWRVLNAADYGTPQTRKRLFVQARRDGRRIIWPDPTHARRGRESTPSGDLKTWEPARSVINFSKRGESVFSKKLSSKTLARIAEGVKRYCRGPVVEPFLVMLRNHAAAQGLDDPLPTITTSGNHHVLIEPEIRPFVVPQGGGGVMFVEPYLVESNHGGDRAARSVVDPLPTITCKNGLGLIEPMIVEIDGVPYVLDLLHRMLDSDELARGQDFDGYAFAGTREQQTMQIGNAVPIKLARALTSAALHDIKPLATSEDQDAAA